MLHFLSDLKYPLFVHNNIINYCKNIFIYSGFNNKGNTKYFEHMTLNLVLVIFTA